MLNKKINHISRTTMKKNSIFLVLALVIFITACNEDLAQKKAQLVKLKEESHELMDKINKLETEIASLDPEFAKEQDKSTLVSVINIERIPFQRKIDVRGTVSSRKNINISSESMGSIQRILVKEGDVVQQGQTLMQIDAEVLRNNFSEVKTALELAETVYLKQSNLWENKIGTEIQYLQAKNNKESLERKLVTLQSQLKLSTVKAPFAGTIEKVAVREGEMAAPGIPLMRLVSLKDMYLEAEVSERFIGKFNKGDIAEIDFNFLPQSIPSTIFSVGQVINEQNRTFTVEVELPGKSDFLRPNQIGIVKLKDYENPEAIIVPSQIILKDSKGDYVFIVEQTDGKTVARKQHIKRGITFNNQTEVLEGLNPKDQVILKGYRNISDGVAIKIAG
jgi:membrane fusion protein, multidrug efflux system